MVHTKLANVPAIIAFIREQGDRIIFKTTAPKGEKLWIQRGGDPQEAVERAAEEGRAP